MRVPPSLAFDTGDFAMMHAQTSTRTPGTSTTQAHACPFDVASAMPPHSTGKERDQESGNDYFGARYYASTMGRWLSPDWAEKPTAVPYADFTNPQSLNLYQYMRNNPLSKADPDGHCDLCWDLVTAVSTYVATHPDVANAIDKVGSSLGIKVSLGVGGGGSVGAAKVEGSATGHVSLSGEGVGAGGQLSGGVRVGPVGAEGSVNVPVVKDGQAVNPLTNTSVSGSATLTNGKASGSGSVTGQETSVGGTYGEGVVGGVEVSAGTQDLKGVARAVGNAVASDTKQYVQDLKETTTCGTGGCARPQ